MKSPSEGVAATPTVREVRLHNGLVALLCPRPGAPVVSVQTWYRVGSREEEKGRTGLAHFLEHLMFKGTETLRKGDIDLVTLRNGGHNNADTSQDRTRYYFTFAADRWERALEIEADRMRGSAFDEHEFHAERGPVLEELRRDHDDPWWRLHEAVEAVAYQVHPYRNPVIGWAEEVIRVPRQDVLDFYRRWYQPANCTLVVAGDVDVAAAEARIRELFEPIPSDPPPEPFVPEEPPQEGERRFELEMEVQVPRMLASFHTVRVRDPEDPVLDVVQMILTGGKSSRLYDRMVRRERLVSEVQAWNDARRDPGLFSILVEMQEGASRERAEQVLWEEIERLGREEPDGEEMERARAMIRAGLVARHATVNGLAESVGTQHVLGGDWRLFLTLEERLLAVTASQVSEAARRFLRRANRTVGWVLPRPQDAPPRAELPGDHVHDIGEPAPETRGEPPILGREATGRLSVELPARRVVLDNGLRLLVLPRPDQPGVSVRLFVDGSQLRERIPAAAALTGQCLDEGAGARSGEEIALYLESRGARLDTGAGGAALQCLPEHTNACLDVLRDVIVAPRFDAEAVERKRGELVSHLMAEMDDPATTARVRLRREIYGEHPLGRRDKGTVEQLHALTRDDLVAHHRACFVPGNGILAVVGPFDADAMEKELRARFECWEARAASLPELPSLALGGPGDVFIEEDRDQLHVLMGHLGIRRTDADYYPLLVGDYVLGTGAGFTDRMSKRLRDEMGLAYTVSAGIARTASREPGVFSAYIGTAPDLLRTATDAMREEIERFVAGPILPGEIEDARRFLLGSFVFHYETAAGTAEQLVMMEWLGLGLDHPKRFVEAVERVTVADVEAAVRRHVHPDRLVIVAIGRRVG